MANPHFINDFFVLDIDYNGKLEVAFKEAGLGDNKSIDYELHARVYTLYACKNKGGNFPVDAKKQEVRGPVSYYRSMRSSKNGHVSGVLRLDPLMLLSPLDCPKGQDDVLVTVEFNIIRIADLTNNIIYDLPSPINYTFHDINNTSKKKERLDTAPWRNKFN